MKTYDYDEALKNDVLRYYDSNREYFDEFGKNADVDALEEELYDKCFNSDSVTGNASGSYFFCNFKAKKAVVENIDALVDALDDFSCWDKAQEILSGNWEYADALIRTDKLWGACNSVAKEIIKKG